MDLYQKLLTEEDFDLLLACIAPSSILFYILLGDIPMFQWVFQNPLSKIRSKERMYIHFVTALLPIS